jgi:hypothetical protein
LFVEATHLLKVEYLGPVVINGDLVGTGSIQTNGDSTITVHGMMPSQLIFSSIVDFLIPHRLCECVNCDYIDS